MGISCDVGIHQPVMVTVRMHQLTGGNNVVWCGS